MKIKISIKSSGKSKEMKANIIKRVLKSIEEKNSNLQ